MNQSPKKVFISYSWDSEKHQEWVLDFANKLRSEGGVDANIDKFLTQTQTVNLNQMMISGFKDSDYIIIILTENYAKKADENEGGVGFENMLAMPLVKENKDKLIFIMRHNGDYKKVFPFHLKDFYGIDFSDESIFQQKFKELLSRIYQVELYKKAPIGKVPDFVSNNALKEQLIEERDASKFNNSIRISSKSEEDESSSGDRMVWLLPRGFLLFHDFQFQTYASWSDSVEYYDYDGNFYGGTHYHESYRDKWDTDIEMQYKKLQIPIGDWNYALRPLRVLQELREVKKPIDILGAVEKLNKSGQIVYYFKYFEDIYLPRIVDEYKELSLTGEIRDLVRELDPNEWTKYSSIGLANKLDAFHQRVEYLRRNAKLMLYKHFGKDHPIIEFGDEVIKEYNKDMSIDDLKAWTRKLAGVLADSLNYK